MITDTVNASPQQPGRPARALMIASLVERAGEEHPDALGEVGQAGAAASPRHTASAYGTPPSIAAVRVTPPAARSGGQARAGARPHGMTSVMPRSGMALAEAWTVIGAARPRQDLHPLGDGERRR